MTLLLLAFALAMDAAALSIINSAKNPHINFISGFRISIIFGIFQAVMPFIGYILGLAFVNFIAEIDHFVAFAILLFLGVKMIKESGDENDENLQVLNTRELIAGAFATSVDAMAVGITFSFENTNILNTCLVIGVVCFIICILACYVGKFLGKHFGRKALILGGMILILIGTNILVSHLGLI